MGDTSQVLSALILATAPGGAALGQRSAFLYQNELYIHFIPLNSVIKVDTTLHILLFQQCLAQYLQSGCLTGQLFLKEAFYTKVKYNTGFPLLFAGVWKLVVTYDSLHVHMESICQLNSISLNLKLNGGFVHHNKRVITLSDLGVTHCPSLLTGPRQKG